MAEIEKVYVDVLAEIITLWFGITGREGSIEREERGIRMCRIPEANGLRKMDPVRGGSGREGLPFTELGGEEKDAKVPRSLLSCRS